MATVSQVNAATKEIIEFAINAACKDCTEFFKVSIDDEIVLATFNATIATTTPAKIGINPSRLLATTSTAFVKTGKTTLAIFPITPIRLPNKSDSVLIAF
jgi:hypothetical protein